MKLKAFVLKHFYFGRGEGEWGESKQAFEEERNSEINLRIFLVMCGIYNPCLW